MSWKWQPFCLGLDILRWNESLKYFFCIRFVGPDMFSCVLKMELKSNQMHQIMIYSKNDTAEM